MIRVCIVTERVTREKWKRLHSLLPFQTLDSCTDNSYSVTSELGPPTFLGRRGTTDEGTDGW